MLVRRTTRRHGRVASDHLRVIYDAAKLKAKRRPVVDSGNVTQGSKGICGAR